MSISFRTAKGECKARILESFNPLYWIETILNLPRIILGYFGLNQNSVSAKILQCIYWLLVPLLLAFRGQIYEYVIALLNKTQGIS